MNKNPFEGCTLPLIEPFSWRMPLMIIRQNTPRGVLILSGEYFWDLVKKITQYIVYLIFIQYRQSLITGDFKQTGSGNIEHSEKLFI